MPLDHTNPIIDIAAIAQMSMDEVQSVKQACDARLDQLRENFITQAAVLGLSVVHGKKPKRRARPAHAD